METHEAPASAAQIDGPAAPTQPFSLPNKPSTAANKRPPWIQYSTEYRTRDTKDLVFRQRSDRPPEPQDEDDRDMPVFELVEEFEVPETKRGEAEVRKSQEGRPSVLAAPVHFIRILSLTLRHALQSVVQYYPDQDLQGDSIKIREPYPILAHHYDELKVFARACELKSESELCVREKDAPTHVRLLLDFLDANIMKHVRAEQERAKMGLFTYEWLWVSFKPGNIIISEPWKRRYGLETNTDQQPGKVEVVHSIKYGVFDSQPGQWHIYTWTLDCRASGNYITRVREDFQIDKWDGETCHDWIRVFADVESLMKDPGASRLLDRGMAYWNLLRKQCHYYQGLTADSPYSAVAGFVMTDMSYYASVNTEHSTFLDVMDGDMRNWTSDCGCNVCKDNKRLRSSSPRFECFYSVPRELDLAEWRGHRDGESIQLFYLLLPPTIPAYVFGTRSWEKLHVLNFSEAKFDERMIDNLIMDEKRLRTLKALSRSFARVNRADEKMTNDQQWAADFVQGKGNGLIILLHGKPGVGKTCTAECIAEFTRRPLMVLTSSDVGTDPKEVEGNLIRHFKRATSWGAVLLIDEADVFMERRSTQDLTRNSLVAGFLRALEFYQGILFLTTNRVGSFDDAFISRIHVQLYYPDFTDDQRQKVWKTFVDKLHLERGNTMRLTIDGKDYIKGREMQALKWNGREIRNAFQTAVSLAEYDAVKDDEGKILVTDDHLRSVVEMSRDFKNYLDELHKGDEGKRAERKYERLDFYDA